MARSHATWRRALAGMGGLALLAGCGGGGSDSGVPPITGDLIVGALPTVAKLNTPLGLAGSRGSGADVNVSFNLKDKEFNASDIQLEYGWDKNGLDGITDGTNGTPNEYEPCTRAVGLGEGAVGLDTAKAGADHLFVWDSAADVPGARYVTQDYQYTPQGRQILGSDGQPLFGATPGIRLRMRANDLAGRPDRWGPWKVTTAFDINNNQQPAVTIDRTIGLEGVNANASGSAADEDVVLNIRSIDEDSADPQAVAVDYAYVAPGLNLANPVDFATLVWLPATTFPGTQDTGLSSSPTPGTAHTFTWDSVADVGATSGQYILRVTPFDSKQELGATVEMRDAASSPVSFTLDNYTIFTDTGTSLSAARIGHRATTLADNRVLITGGRTTVAGGSINTAELFYPGIGSTTLGAVAPTASMGAARAYHSQTRLLDDRILVVGGYNGAGAPLNSLEIYNPVSGTWTTLGATLGTARARHSAVLLASGNVLIAGGVDAGGNALASAEIFNVNTNAVSAAGTMAAARHSVRAVLLPDGKAFIPGGKNTAGTALATTELYNPVTNTWSAGAAMASPRAEHSVAAATNGDIIVAGGVNASATALSSVATYSPKTNTWATGAFSMASARAGHVGILLGDGKILLAGGSSGASVVGSADVLTTGGTFDSPNGAMKTARRDAETALLNNGRPLIIGGTSSTGATLSSIEVFNPDGGFNTAPVAKITTPTEAQSWAFGALFPIRLVDPEGDDARVIFQYSIAGGVWLPCTSKGGPYLDATNDPDTIAGDINEGTVALATATADSALPIDPVLKNTTGDNLFVWDMAADIARADYPVVSVRCIPFGGGRGVMATTTSFTIAKNTRVIPKFEGFSGDVAGNVDVWYHLRDIDGLNPTFGESARIEMEYAVDLNDNGQILAADGETWKACSEVTNPAGSEGLGAGWTLATAKNYTTRAANTTGWHLFRWDSVRDVGSPDVAPDEFTNVFLRITPYDNPDGLPTTEAKGRQEQMGSTYFDPATGFVGPTLVIDPTGLYLTRIENEGNTQGYTLSPASGSLPLTNFKLDETLVLTFSNPVDPASVNANTLKILVGNRVILGTYASDIGTNKVYFYPRIQEYLNNQPRFTATDAQTILFRGNTVKVEIPAYVPGSDPSTANCLRQNGWVAGEGAKDIVNLVARNYTSAATVTSAAGTAAFYDHAAPAGPVLTSSTPVHMSAGNATNTTFTLNFTNQISGESVVIPGPTPTLSFRVDLDGDGLADASDPLIPGTFSFVNTAGTFGGTASSVLTFTITGGFTLPTGSQIVVDFAGVTGGFGDPSSGGTSAKLLFTTSGASLTAGAPYVETFDLGTLPEKRDEANTNALWDSATFPDILTGLRDGGTGLDGVPTVGDTNVTAGGITTRTFSSKATYNFSSLTIPRDEVWRFTGTGANLAVTILVTGDVDIAGVLDVSGGDGETAIMDYAGTTVNYPTDSVATLKGGAGIAGAGKGADSQYTSSSSTSIDGLDGAFGVGGSAAGAGKKGVKGASSTLGTVGGGGAGHAQAGMAGGKYTNSTSTSYGTPGAAGSAYGTSDFSGGITAGSGGASGSMLNYTTLTYDHCHGGGGGGGGGALKIGTNGSLTIRGTGKIDASGGNGGGGWYYWGGSGGGGSGGSIWIIAGSTINMHGTLDVRGGIGGFQVGYSNSGYLVTTGRYGPAGGDGSAGRIRLEGPNVSGTATMRFNAGLSMATIGSVTPVASTTAFPGSTSTTINVDSLPKDGAGFVNYSTMNIPAGVTITLTGTNAAKFRFNSSVTINGTLRSDGALGSNGLYSNNSYGAPTAALGGVGGQKGGVTNTSSVSVSSTSVYSGGVDGSGTGGGKGGGSPYSYIYNTSYGSSYTYYTAGGGGASNLYNSLGTAGGKTRYAMGYYQPTGGDGGPAGAGYTDPASILTTTLTGGSGGGGATNAVWNTWSTWAYFYGGGNGGGGGGAIAIETAGTFTMGATGVVSLKGGNGGYGYTTVGGGGAGGGSGGNFFVRAVSVTLNTNATVDTAGGIGGKSYNSVYYKFYNDGGDGGRGAMRIESVNAPTTFLNYGGMLGYSTTTGSLTTKAYSSGDTGTSDWTTATTFAPNFTSSTVTKAGNVQVNLQGAMIDPLTGGRSTTYTVTQDLAATAVTAAGTDAADGHYHFRFVYKLLPPTLAVPAAPEIDNVTLNHEYR